MARKAQSAHAHRRGARVYFVGLGAWTWTAARHPSSALSQCAMGLSLPLILGLAALSLTPQRPPISAPVLIHSIYREKSGGPPAPRRRPAAPVIVPWNLRVCCDRVFCFCLPLFFSIKFQSPAFSFPLNRTPESGAARLHAAWPVHGRMGLDAAPRVAPRPHRARAAQVSPHTPDR